MAEEITVCSTSQVMWRYRDISRKNEKQIIKCIYSFIAHIFELYYKHSIEPFSENAYCIISFLLYFHNLPSEEFSNYLFLSLFDFNAFWWNNLFTFNFIRILIKMILMTFSFPNTFHTNGPNFEKRNSKVKKSIHTTLLLFWLICLWWTVSFSCIIFHLIVEGTYKYSLRIYVC